MVNRKTKKAINKYKKTRKQQKNKIKKGGGDEDKYKNVKIDVIITNGEEETDEGEKRELDFNIKSSYPFNDYLKEVDAYLKKIDEGLLEFNDPNKYEQMKKTKKPKIYSYKYGYEECDKDGDDVKEEETVKQKEEEVTKGGAKGGAKGRRKRV
jgi:hypothetical protein